MIEITNPKNCCGCSACANICNHNAITMMPDALGFLYPHVDKSKCVDCGLCEKICAFNDEYDVKNNFKKPICFGVRHIDENQIRTSRSGAVFVALSDYILEQGGVVYGAAFDADFNVLHTRATTKEDRNKFKGSKYVQSKIGNTFAQVKKDLQDGYLVMFSGTPCQCAGLSSFISDRYKENLYLIDIVCHGTPSPVMWKDYKNYIEKKYKSKIINVNFRDKSIIGWSSHMESFYFQNGKYRLLKHWAFLFGLNIMQMKACANCHFCNLTRPGDISIADFWYWEKAAPGFNKDNKGASLVLCNTDKGIALFNNIRADIESIDVDINKCIQPNMIEPSKEHPMRDVFEKEYVLRGFNYVYFKYGDEGWRFRLQPKEIAREVKNVIRNYLIEFGLWTRSQK